MALVKVSSLVETVDAAGTAQALSTTSLEVVKAVVKAQADNTGNIFVGDSSVSSATGLVLDAGQEVVLDPARGYIDLSQVYIDAGTTDDGVEVLYYR